MVQFNMYILELKAGLKPLRGLEFADALYKFKQSRKNERNNGYQKTIQLVLYS